MTTENGPYMGLRERLGNRKKVAIVGFCQTNRDLAPYEDPEFEIWGLNRGMIFMPRADRRFEMHGANIFASQDRRPGSHVEWLKAFSGPVYVHARFQELGENQVVYPLMELADFFGPWVLRIGEQDEKGRMLNNAIIRDTTREPYLNSSIAYEIGLAIYEGFEEIHLYGVDLQTEAEYAWQKPGVEHLLGFAAGRGIKVVLPANCPLLKGTLYGRGFMSERPEHMGYEQIAHRVKALNHEAERLQLDITRLQGGRTELVEYVMAQMPPGIPHEKLDERRKEFDRAIANAQGKLQQTIGKIEESGYWLHQTMAGQEPGEAIQQLQKLDDKRLEAEGPLSEFETLTYRNGNTVTVYDLNVAASLTNGNSETAVNLTEPESVEVVEVTP